MVLYEMLTGKRLFAGETMTEVLAAVIERQPPLGQTPAQVRTLLRRCLEKDPNKRLRDIGDAMALVEREQVENVLPPTGGRRYWLPWAVAVILAIVAALAWAPWRTSRKRADNPFVQVDLDVGPDEVSQPVLAPNGSLIVFVFKGQLVTRRLDQTKITPLVGTEGASFPFFSPDGRWVAFFADSKLKKIALEGRPQDCSHPLGGQAFLPGPHIEL